MPTNLMRRSRRVVVGAGMEAIDEPVAERAMFSVCQSVGRMGTPQESRFMTGRAIVLDGGAKL